jgi:hypothetical protein
MMWEAEGERKLRQQSVNEVVVLHHLNWPGNHTMKICWNMAEVEVGDHGGQFVAGQEKVELQLEKENHLKLYLQGQWQQKKSLHGHQH